MKRMNVVLLLTLFAAAAVIAVGCGSAPSRSTAASDPDYTYRITGQFASWGSNYDQKFMMESVSASDSRLRPISAALRDAMYIYLGEYTPNPNVSANWNVKYLGAGIDLDGVYAVKVIRLERDLEGIEPSGWMHNMWIPSTEAGGVRNLSPDTLYTPLSRSDEEAAAAGDGLGSNNDNPVLLKGPATYYVVFAVMNDRSRAMGAVVK
ncbi:MAG: hypothetical protein FWG99_00790 [Treponema sp.]|nr:hypothetical protein [Treponema sp.]